MGKPTTNWPSDSAITFRPENGREARMSLEEMAAEALVVPSYTFLSDGEWHPENAALQQAAGDSSALVDFYRKQQESEIEIRRYERRYQETGEPIAVREAVALANRIKKLRLFQPFDGREDFIKFRAGQCLTLKEGQAAGLFRTGSASLEAKWAPAWAGRRLPVTLAIPAELQVEGPDATFGAQTIQWRRERCETLVREIAIRGSPPGSPASRMYDGGDFSLVGFTGSPRSLGSPTSPGPIVDYSVVLAPDEDAIREYVKLAESSPDYWDALDVAARVLRQCGQPLGDALTDWVVQRSNRPNGQKIAKAPAKELRNHAIIEAVRALERCGIPPTRNRDKRWLVRAHGWEGEIDPDYNPPSGCAIVAEAFGMSARAVEKVLMPVRK